MKKYLVPILALTLISVGCSTAWLTTLDSILAAAAPALISILQIAALSKGTPVNSGLAAKINGDAANLKTIAQDLANASAAAQPQVCAQLQAALTTYESDLPAVLQVAQVSNVNTQNKIETLSALVVGVFGSIEPLIPNCKAPAAATFKANLQGGPPLTVKNFVQSYNAVLLSPVNDPPVDQNVHKFKLHNHSLGIRILTLGIAK